MKTKKLKILFMCLITLFALQACEEDENENETVISTSSSSESHRSGENCMNCHKSGGSGEGWFTAAGTVYDYAQTSVYPDAVVKLYTGRLGTGELLNTIEVDQNGNFYTTKAINFGDGIYAAVEGNSTTKYMATSITSGACNSCHGVTTNKIWTE